MAITLREVCGWAFQDAFAPSPLLVEKRWGTLQALRDSTMQFQSAPNQNQTEVSYTFAPIICEGAEEGADLCDMSSTALTARKYATMKVDRSAKISSPKLVIRKSDLECTAATEAQFMQAVRDQVAAMYTAAVDLLDRRLLERLYTAANPTLPNGYTNTVNPYTSISTVAGQIINPQWLQQVDMAFKSVRMGLPRKKIVGGLAVDGVIATTGNARQPQADLWFDDSNNQAYANVFGSNPTNGEGAVLFLKEAVRLFYWSETLAQTFGGVVPQIAVGETSFAGFESVLGEVDRIFAQSTTGIWKYAYQDTLGIVWDLNIRSQIQCIDPRIGDELIVSMYLTTTPLLDFPYGLGASCELPANPVYTLNFCLPAVPEACDVPIPTPSETGFCLEISDSDGCTLGNSGVSVSVVINGGTPITGTVFGQWNLSQLSGIAAVLNVLLAQNGLGGNFTVVSGVLRYFAPVSSDFEVGDDIVITTACGGEVTLTAILCPGQEEEGGGEGGLGLMAMEGERGLTQRKVRKPRKVAETTPVSE